MGAGDGRELGREVVDAACVTFSAAIWSRILVSSDMMKWRRANKLTPENLFSTCSCNSSRDSDFELAENKRTYAWIRPRV